MNVFLSLYLNICTSWICIHTWCNSKVFTCEARHIRRSHANWNNRTSRTRQTDSAAATRHSTPQPLSLCVLILRQDVCNNTEGLIKKYLKEICFETLWENMWIIWFIFEDMLRQPSVLLSCEKRQSLLEFTPSNDLAKYNLWLGS